MSSLFKMPSMPAPPQLEMPKVENVPSAEDAAREAQEAEDMRRRNRNRKFQKENLLLIDAVTDISKINSKLLKDLSLISPFGIQNKEPIFVIKNVRPLFNRIIGNKKNHIMVLKMLLDCVKHKLLISFI